MSRGAGGPAWHADRRVWQALFVIALAGALVLALRPAIEHEPMFWHADKVKHVLAFAVLWVLGRWAGVPVLALAVGLLGYGGAIELLQGLTVTREASWADWAADAAGLALGHAVASRWSPLPRRAG